MKKKRRGEWADDTPPKGASSSPTTGVGDAQRKAGDTGSLGRRRPLERLP